MKEIQPRFAGRVAFFAVNIDSSLDLAKLQEFSKENGYPWRVGQSDIKMLKAFDVTIQSTKIAIGKDGVIVYRAGYGEGTSQEWASVLGNMGD